MYAKTLKRMLGGILVGAGVAVSGAALAVPTLTLTDLGTGFVGTAVDTDGDGLVSFMGQVGNFEINISVGTTKPLLGSAGKPELDLFNQQINSVGAGGTLQIAFSENDFLGSGEVSFNSSIGGTRDGDVLFDVYVNADNLIGSTAGTKVASLSFGDGSFPNNAAFSGSTAGVADLGASLTAYSITQVAQVSLGSANRSGQNTSFDAATAVPEPATVALLGAGLLGIGAATRRRRAKA